MIRTKNLENAIYKQKYKEIYKLIFTADIDQISEYSNWMHKGKKNYVEIHKPLWIVMESKILNKRIWITHEWGKYEIATAQLDLDINSSAYHDSHEYYDFKNQKELVAKLTELLEPCVEKEPEVEEEIDIC